MQTASNLYVKHHSFKDFFSSLNTDIELQRRRVVHYFQNNSQAYGAIGLAVLNDLTSSSSDVDYKITPHIADELSKIDDQHIGRYTVNRYRYDVYPKKKILDAYPPYLQIEPSSVCNYRCVFCYQTDAQFTTKANGYMGSMSFDVFKEIIDQAEGHIEFFSLASRGEPLLCKDIDKMLVYCSGKFLGLKINTNASMLNEQHCHAILSGGVNTLVFSADAAKEPLYSQLRVKGNLDKVLSNVRLFQEIRRKHYPASKIITRVSGVKYGSDQDMNSMISLWGELVDQISFVAYNPWENVYLAPVNETKISCSDLWRRMFIWFDGLTNPCDTDFKSTLSIGNLKTHSISQLWRSQQYENLRQAHLEKRRGSLNPCQRCSVV
ncbi:MAG: radical SAM protein [Candidatus Omnitrophica bacterium]|nr:radical SAM protein [Candidatus Omnitrophota bacterium]